MRVLGALILLLTVGVVLVSYSATMPEYHDPALAREVLQGNFPDAEEGEPSLSNGHSNHPSSERWFAAMDELRTNKWLVLDFGIGCILMALSLFLLFSYLRAGAIVKTLQRRFSSGGAQDPQPQIYSLKGLAQTRTPRARWKFIVYGTLVHFGVMASWWISIHIEFIREYYPWWADSIGIPIWGIESFARTSWPLLVIAGIVFLLPAKLPTTLWGWNKDRRVWSWFWTLIHAIPGGILLFLMAFSFISATVWGTPFLIFGLYLIESSRSAGLAPPGPRGKTGIFSRLGLKRGP